MKKIRFGGNPAKYAALILIMILIAVAAFVVIDSRDNSCSISGLLWNDGNGTAPSDWNGLYDSGEAPVAGFTVYLYKADDLTAPIAQTVTGSDGRYSFEDPEPGNYIAGLESASVGEIGYLLPTAVAGDNKFAASDWEREPLLAVTGTIQITAGKKVTGVNAGMRLPMGFTPETAYVIDIGSGAQENGTYEGYTLSGTGTRRVLTFDTGANSNTYTIMQTGTSQFNSIIFQTGVVTQATVSGIDLTGIIDVQGTADLILLVEGTNKVQGSIIVSETNSTTVASITIDSAAAPGVGSTIGSLAVSGPGMYDAAIGGSKKNNGGSITISGGTVDVTAGSRGAGIGGGGNDSGNGGSGGSITISGGRVDVKIASSSSLRYSAGIGGGIQGTGGNITITGNAVVTATSKEGAAIGSGFKNAGGNITITGNAKVTATSVQGAGIGGGYQGAGGNIIITGNTTVTATTTSNSAGIGGGYQGAGGNITITGSAAVTATGMGGAIGSGLDGAPAKITIDSTATVKAYTRSYTGKPPIDADSTGNNGDGFYVNNYLDKLTSSALTVRVYEAGTDNLVNTLTLPSNQAGYAYTTGSTSAENFNEIAYNPTSNALVGRVLRADDNSLIIPSVNTNAVLPVKLITAYTVTNYVANTALDNNLAIQTSDYFGTLTPNAGYSLPETIGMRRNTYVFTNFTYDHLTGEIIIPSAFITGNFVITGTTPPASYTVTPPANTAVDNKTATQGTAYSGTISADPGYVLPQTVTMTVGNTSYSGFAYDPATGAVSVPAAGVTGNIVIIGAAVPLCTLTYDLNGGTAGTGPVPNPVTDLIPQTGYILSAAAPAHPTVGNISVVFIGWTSAADTHIYAMADTPPATVTQIDISGDTEVYAVWGYDTDGNGIPDVLETFILSGTVTQGGMAVAGATLTYTVNGTPGSYITTSSGYVIAALAGSSVTITGVTGYGVIPALPLTFAMTSDRVQNLAVTAQTVTMHYLTASSDAGSSISPSGTIAVERGGSQTFSFSAVKGYVISSVKIDNVPLPRTQVDLGYYTFANVMANHNIAAESEESHTSLTINIAEGSGRAEYSVNGSAFVTYVSPADLPDHCSLTVRAYADSGYAFERWETPATEIASEIEFGNLFGDLTLMLFFVPAGSGGDDGEDRTFLWIGIIILIAAILLILWSVLFFRRSFGVVKINSAAAEVIGEEKARRKREYRFRIEGNAETISYRIGDGERNSILPDGNGECVIPEGVITGTVTIEVR